MTITTNAALNLALGKCQGGEELDPLDMREPVLIQNRTFSDPVKLTGFVRPEIAPFTNISQRVVRLVNCSGFVFDEIEVQGSPQPSNGYFGRGLDLDGGSNITIRKAKVHRIHQGVTARRVADLTIAGSDFEQIHADAIFLTQTTRVLAEYNWFHNYAVVPFSEVHQDAGQMSGKNGATADCNGLLWQYNLCDWRRGSLQQGLWCSDAMFGGHLNVVVRHNLSLDGMQHQLAVHDCPDYLLENNLVLRSVGSPALCAIRTLGQRGRLVGNLASFFDLAPARVPLVAPPLGNAIVPPLERFALDAYRDAWLATHRAAAPTPTREQLLAEAVELVGEGQAIYVSIAEKLAALA